MARMNIALLSGEAELPEDEVMGADAVEEVIETIDVTDDSVEVGEVAEMGGDVVDTSDTIEAASDDAELIEETAEIAERAQEEGGLPPVAAEALNNIVSKLLARNGVKSVNFATESFAGKAGRIQATSVACEGWKEKAKEIWDKIVKAVMAAVEKVKLFFKALFNRAEKLRQQGEALVKAAKAKGAAKADAKPIDIGAAAQFLYSGSEYQGGEKLAGAFETHAKQVEGQAVGSLASCSKAVGVAKELFTGVFKQEAFDADLKKFGFPKGEAAADKSEGLPAGFEASVIASFMGGRNLYAVSPKSDATVEQIKAGVKEVRMFVATAKDYKAAEKSEGAAASADTIAKVGAALSAHYGKYAELQKKLDKLAEEVKAVVKTTPKMDGEVAQGNAKVAVKVAQAIGNLATVTQQQIYSYDVQVGGAVYSYCAKSLKALDGKKEEAAPAAEPAAK